MNRVTVTLIEFFGWVSATLAVLILLGEIFLVAFPAIGGFIPPNLLSIVGVLQATVLAVVFFWMGGIARDLAAIRKALTGEPEAPPSEAP